MCRCLTFCEYICLAVNPSRKCEYGTFRYRFSRARRGGLVEGICVLEAVGVVSVEADQPAFCRESRTVINDADDTHLSDHLQGLYSLYSRKSR